jgi:hypothetical protein
VELAVAAGRRCGAGRLEELTIEAPVVVPRTGGVSIQVLVGAPDEGGGWDIEVYASDGGDGARWTRIAHGALAHDEVEGEWLALWPPTDAEEIDLRGAYDALAARGFGYGPTFQGLRRVWRRGHEVFAEVALPESVATTGYAVHPALADAALQAAAVSGLVGEGLVLPFSFTEVTVHGGSSPSALRVKLARVGEGVSVALADTSGMPVATMGSVSLRPPREAKAAEARFHVAWVPIARGAAAAASDGVVVHAIESHGSAGARSDAERGGGAIDVEVEGEGDAPGAARRALGSALAALHAHVTGATGGW